MKKARILYSIDDTTTELNVDGHKITAQIFPDGRSMVQVLDEHNNVVRRVLLSKVYLIDQTE